jgi:arylsulfatase
VAGILRGAPPTSSFDLKEERDVLGYNTWVMEPVVKIVGAFLGSLQKYPPIKVGTPDPYTPPK